MELKGTYGTAKVFTDNIESGAKEQIIKLLNQDFIEGTRIRIMPDVHQGVGCVIGFTADMGNKVIPNIVGVDIGCGILTVELGNIKIDFQTLDEIIYNKIPAGNKVHNNEKCKFDKLEELYCYRNLKEIKRLRRSIGTLGGGNHFIEVDVDENNNKYLTIHSGSRNLGKQVAEIYQKMAVNLCSEGSKTKYPKDLCFLTGAYREKYLHDMKICQEYASLNRKTIAEIIITSLLKKTLDEFNYFETVHNYIDFRDNIIRKGAISAYKGEKVIIPINMRDGSIIAVGKGNPDWNYSAPHGAGRIMSRNMAKDELTLEKFKKSMEGIYSTSINKHTLDEAPFAYKSMEEIIENIKDTVDIIKIIKPIYNFKAS
ncbi:MAG TPA: RtcB family protein [Tissierellaceae bacterium]